MSSRHYARERCVLIGFCALVVAALGAAAVAAGPDVLYSNIGSTTNYGNIGGIRAYALGSHTCNIGDMNLLWTNNGTPGLAMNAYRLYQGRLEQIGQSWVKTACCAAAGSGCGLPCNGQGGSVLGAGCLDVYSSGWNGGQTRLGPRSGINAFTGAFDPIPGGTGNAIFRRLQIPESDLDPANYPGALYFAEGIYVGTDDAGWGNAMNNASYQRVTFDGGYNMVLTGPMYVDRPAIYALYDHGLGAGVPDPNVQISNVDVPNEGRFVFASRVVNLGGGQWEYRYAVYNFNSHRSAGSFSVPIVGSGYTSIGFNDVDYHSGEPYDNTDWNAQIANGALTWSSPQTYAQNQNSNALRWGTMYSFWFRAPRPPSAGNVTIGLFRPGTPAAVTASAPVPRGCLAGLGNVNTDLWIDGGDIRAFVSCMITGSAGSGDCGCADMDENGMLDDVDVAMFVARLLQ
ncbi:MAG: hypothetical protein HUU22_02720 [Phycisphaerae bacterium]|nr:hypothetical protein [Phycisphaerae bacterium]NUQ44927.1 hypothetical protein [Phycisphaerae bacterium]